MATIETINVDVVSNVTKFVAGFTRAGKQTKWFRDRTKAAGKAIDKFNMSMAKFADRTLRKVERRLSRVGKSMSKFAKQANQSFGRGSALALAASATGAVYGIDRVANSIDEVARKAELFNIPVNQLRGLRFAATQTGLSVETLDMAMQRMSRRIGEVAATGKGEARSVLDRLGLNAVSLSKLTGDQQLFKIADGISKIASQSERLAALQKVFDSEGVGLGRFIKDGAAGIKKFIDEAKQVGGIISEADVERMAKFSQAWDRLKLRGEGTLQRLVITIEPLATKTIDKLDKAIGLLNVQGTGGKPTRPEGVGRASGFLGSLGFGGSIGTFFGEQQKIYDYVLGKLARTGAGIPLGKGADRSFARIGFKENPFADTAANDDIFKSLGGGGKLPLTYRNIVKPFGQGVSNLLRGGLSGIGGAVAAGDDAIGGFGNRFRSGFLENERLGRERRKRDELNGRVTGITRADSAEGFAALRSNKKNDFDRDMLDTNKKQMEWLEKIATKMELLQRDAFFVNAGLESSFRGDG